MSRIVVNEETRTSVEHWEYDMARQTCSSHVNTAMIGETILSGYHFGGRFYTIHGMEYVSYDVIKYNKIGKRDFVF